ncbi:MAG TPA: DUF2306 domain-containing protein, partial [Edaphobacter sp.]
MSTLPAASTDTSVQPAGPPPRRSVKLHHVLWIALGVMGLTVLAFTEYPIFLGSDPFHARSRFLHELLILIPHATAGIIATTLGPFLFSTRFRQRHLTRHRIMGRVYCISVAVAAPTAYLLTSNLANGVGSFLWAACTFAAYQTARNRQLQAHRQWMIRSYIFTLNFIFTRVLNPIPAWAHLDDAHFFMILMGF